MDNMELYEKFRKVPKEAQKLIEAGRIKGFTDINPMWRLKILTEQFGPCGIGWFYEITEKWLDDGANGERTANVQINLFIKVGESWSQPIVGIGGSMFIANQSKGFYVSDECYKMALTDAISVACKALGIGADIYYAKDRTKYNASEDEKKNIDEALQKKLDDRKKILIIKLEDKATSGTVSFNEAWGLLKDSDKTLVGNEERKRLLTMAKNYDTGQ